MVSLVRPATRAVESILPFVMAVSTSVILVAPMSIRPLEEVATLPVNSPILSFDTSVTEPRSRSRRLDVLRTIEPVVTLPAPVVVVSAPIVLVVASYFRPRPVSEVASVPSSTVTVLVAAAVLSVVTLSVPPLTLAVPASFTSRTERVTSASSVANAPALTCTVLKVLSASLMVNAPPVALTM